MRLREFRVTHFRNVIDSGAIAVDERVTCLVGKNELGKTALLQALRRVNPVYSAKFDAAAHYPRWLFIPDRKHGTIDGTAAVTATFDLDHEDVEQIERQFGVGILTSTEVISEVGYELDALHFSIDEQKAIQHIIDAALDGQDPLRRKLNSIEDIEQFNGIVAALEEDAQVVAGVDPAVPVPPGIARLQAELNPYPDDGALLKAVTAAVAARLPRFFYFSAYSTLPGRVDLREVAAEASEPAADAMQTARALLKLVGTDAEMLSRDEYELRKAEMEAVSNDLTAQMREYWHQSEDLDVEIAVDKTTEQTVNGQTAVARFLDIRVRDRRHQYTNNFSERSSGFQWFFSFLAAFSEFDGRKEPVVILLDEPALTLHGRAQGDFLRFIEERLAPAGQVLYTTHSPFMVDPGAIDRVRIVEDRGIEKGSVATQDILSVDQDSLFPAPSGARIRRSPKPLHRLRQHPRGRNKRLDLPHGDLGLPANPRPRSPRFEVAAASHRRRTEHPSLCRPAGKTS